MIDTRVSEKIQNSSAFAFQCRLIKKKFPSARTVGSKEMFQIFKPWIFREASYNRLQISSCFRGEISTYNDVFQGLVKISHILVLFDYSDYALTSSSIDDYLGFPGHARVLHCDRRA